MIKDIQSHTRQVKIEIARRGEGKMMCFINVYANYKTNSIMDSELMKEEIKLEKICDIEKVVKAFKNSLITVDECVKMIAEI